MTDTFPLSANAQFRTRYQHQHRPRKAEQTAATVLAVIRDRAEKCISPGDDLGLMCAWFMAQPEKDRAELLDMALVLVQSTPLGPTGAVEMLYKLGGWLKEHNLPRPDVETMTPAPVYYG